MLYIKVYPKRKTYFKGTMGVKSTFSCYNCAAVYANYGLQVTFYCPDCKEELPDAHLISTNSLHRTWWHRSPEVP